LRADESETMREEKKEDDYAPEKCQRAAVS
jgi:hypothetical protein